MNLRFRLTSSRTFSAQIDQWYPDDTYPEDIKGDLDEWCRKVYPGFDTTDARLIVSVEFKNEHGQYFDYEIPDVTIGNNCLYKPSVLEQL